MLAPLELLLIAFSGGEFEPERDLTEASYGARNWLVSLANTLKKERIHYISKSSTGINVTYHKEF
jgi:hypothetical protein